MSGPMFHVFSGILEKNISNSGGISHKIPRKFLPVGSRTEFPCHSEKNIRNLTSAKKIQFPGMFYLKTIQRLGFGWHPKISVRF
jgi:hypothetical protein